MPRRASAGTLVTHRIGDREIDRDVDVRPSVVVGVAAVARRHRIDHAGDLAVVLGGELADQPAHLAVADEQDCASRAGSSQRRRPSSEERLVQARSSRRGTSASRSTNVMFRREAACDTSRSGMPSSAVTARAEQRRIGPQILADRADDRHLGLARSPRRSSRRLSTIVVEPARVVDGHRHADLGGRDDVDRRLEPLEHLEQPAQEAVRHQHPRRRDVDHRHVALAGERRQLRRRPAARPP